MSKIRRAALGGLLFSLWLMCFVFPVELFQSFQNHTPLDALFGQLLVDFLALWTICGVVAHGVIGMFDDLNKRNRRDDDQDHRNGNDRDSNDHNGGTRGGDPSDNDRNDRGPRQ